MSELQPLIDLLTGQHGWLSSVFAWVGALRLAAKPITAAIDDGMHKAIVRAVESDEQDDDRLVERLLGNPAYRTVAFLLDWLTSIKLPTLKAFRAALAAKG